MRLADLRPGWHTDFILHRFDAEVIERDDCLVVRTPSNPTYYWGNCLHLLRLPRDDELAHWLARFDDEITSRQPASRHVAIGSADEYRGERRPGWQAAGFDLVVQRMLRLTPGALRPPARPPRGAVRLRPLDLAVDGDALIDVEMTDAEGFEPAGYRAYLRDQHRRYRAMQSAGILQWFGIECDGTLAATCGLIRDRAETGADGRFQRVVTHAAWRRRGLASWLVHGVCRFGFDRWGAGALYMAADPDDVAIGIYRSLGFADLSLGAGLQRKSPKDRAAGPGP
ncbi:MAG: GNAT family N-acetyltransferase [Rubrivivax sp.]|nr:GNAT family N-acetyltransferase [Rubrivivax sp.]